MKCPRCGQEAFLVGLPAGIYQTTKYRCYCSGEVNFSSDSPQAMREAEQSRAQSASNREAIERSNCMLDPEDYR